jgi:hypothetical protein
MRTTGFSNISKDVAISALEGLKLEQFKLSPDKRLKSKLESRKSLTFYKDSARKKLN